MELKGKLDEISNNSFNIFLDEFNHALMNSLKGKKKLD